MLMRNAEIYENEKPKSFMAFIAIQRFLQNLSAVKV